MNLHGVLLPVTTPFAGDVVAPARLAANISRYQAHGVAGYLVLGSTGEATLLDEGEKIALLAAAREAVPSSATLLAGVGLESTAATARLARRAAEAGADGLLVLTPFFFRTRMTAEALVRHFRTVADASPVPILLYNVPAHTSLVIPPSVVETLATHANVIGLKDSSGDLPWLLDVLARVPETFQIVCGSAPAFLPALHSGAVGGILAIADAFPELAVKVYARHAEGCAAEALALQKQLAAATRLVLGTHGIAGVKAAMETRGLAGGDPRPPLLPLTGDDRDVIAGEVERLLARGVIEHREISEPRVYSPSGDEVEILEIWLVRHGETTCSRDGVLAGWTDVPLTEIGVAQAEALRPLLADTDFDGVWSSDLRRAVQSALLARGAPVADPRLREINFGELEGKSWATLDPVNKKGIVEFNGWRAPGGESLDEVRARVHGFLSELPFGRHLLFTHGGVIRLLTREVGHEGFVPTGTVVGADWTHRTVLFTQESSIPSPRAFEE